MKKIATYLLLILLWIMVVPSCSKDPAGTEEETVEIPSRTYSITTEELSCSRDGIKIYGKLVLPEGRDGRMPVVIFSHGLLGHHTDCLPYAEALARKGYAGYCFDFIGGSLANLSGGSYKQMSILTEMEDLRAVIDMIEKQGFTDKNQIYLAGASQGGLVSAMVAAAQPSRIRGMIQMFPAFNIPELVSSYLFILYKGDVSAMPESTSLLGFTFYKKYVEDAIKVDPYAEIGKYEGPVLIMHGDKDLLVPYSSSEKAVKAYKNATLQKFEGQGHGFDEEGTEKAITSSLEFLTRLNK